MIARLAACSLLHIT